MSFNWDGMVRLPDKYVGYNAQADFSRDDLYNLQCDNVKIQTWLYKNEADLEGVPLATDDMSVELFETVRDEAIQQGFLEYTRQLDDPRFED